MWDLTKDKLTGRDLLRHGTTSMTEKYIHGIDPRLEEAQNKLVNAIMNAPSPPPGTPRTKLFAIAQALGRSHPKTPMARL